MNYTESPWEPVKPFIDDYKFKEDHIYIVEVSWKSSNPVHRAFLHVGFVGGDGKLGNYCEVWCNSYDDAEPAENAHYLKVIKDLGPLDDPDKSVSWEYGYTEESE